MEKKASLFIGIFLLVLGVLALAGNLLLSARGLAFIGSFTLWPLLVVAAGLLFVMPPFFFRRIRGLSGMAVPGLPVLTTGAILLACTLSGNWSLWAKLWPLEVIAIGLAFVFMTIWMRLIWLLIPAFLVGFTGLVLQFCAATGLWASWAVLWVVEPLALGLALLIIGLVKHYHTLAIVGGGFCAFAGLGVAASSFFAASDSWLLNLIGPGFVLAMGVLILFLGFWRPGKKSGTESQAH